MVEPPHAYVRARDSSNVSLHICGVDGYRKSGPVLSGVRIVFLSHEPSGFERVFKSAVHEATVATRVA
ncbi:hypothetical protein HID58_075191 [Brassica napus]|uniref:Uncharacterized protein n=2 Tax=Brassica napus TaxID=3708 RepID=A0ABQ7YK57_BRANA|nr:hypothetical protein HID58_075191 [Brassica napus]